MFEIELLIKKQQIFMEEGILFILALCEMALYVIFFSQSLKNYFVSQTTLLQQIARCRSFFKTQRTNYLLLYLLYILQTPQTENYTYINKCLHLQENTSVNSPFKNIITILTVQAFLCRSPRSLEKEMAVSVNGSPIINPTTLLAMSNTTGSGQRFLLKKTELTSNKSLKRDKIILICFRLFLLVYPLA